MIRPIKSIAAVCLLTALVAACGGGSPPSSPSSSAPPQSPAPQNSASAASAPVADGDVPPHDDYSDQYPAPATADAQATDTQAQQDNYYGRPAPQTQKQDDPQAQWKARRDGNNG